LTQIKTKDFLLLLQDTVSVY